VPLVVQHRHAFGQQSVNADVLHAQRRPIRRPPVAPFAFPAHDPTPIPHFLPLSEKNLLSYGVQQELLSGHVRVLVEVVADAFREPVGWRYPFGSHGLKTAILIKRDHNLDSFWQPTGLTRILASGIKTRPVA